MPIRGKRYSDECGGEFNYTLTSRSTNVCGHKEAVSIRVTKGGKVVWAPSDPLCLAPSINTATRKGRARAIEEAAGFFDYHRCGKGPLEGAKRSRRRR